MKSVFTVLACIHNTVLSASLTTDNEWRYVMRHTPLRVHQVGKSNSLRNVVRPYEDNERLKRKSSLEVI
jgi:hypothetical protein